MLEGIDVSVWQKTTPPLEGLAFVIARATYGCAPDARYWMHAANVRAAGLAQMAYAFGIHDQIPADQARVFLGIAKSADYLWLDLEEERDANTHELLRPPMTVQQAAQFIYACHAGGRPCGLYHQLSGHPGHIGQDANWIAAPGIPIERWHDLSGGAFDPAVDHWTVWQNTGERPTGGDGDLFNGDAAALARFLGRSDVDRTITQWPAPRPVTVNAPLERFDDTRPHAKLPSKLAPGRYTADAQYLIEQTGVPHGTFVRVATGPQGRCLVAEADVELGAVPGPVDLAPGLYRVP